MLPRFPSLLPLLLSPLEDAVAVEGGGPFLLSSWRPFGGSPESGWCQVGEEGSGRLLLQPLLVGFSEDSSDMGTDSGSLILLFFSAFFFSEVAKLSDLDLGTLLW